MSTNAPIERCRAWSGCIAPVTHTITNDDGDEWSFCEAHWAELERRLERASVEAAELRAQGCDERMLLRIMLVRTEKKGDE